MREEILPVANEKFTDFLDRLSTLVSYSKGTTNGWFGFVNPGDMPIGQIEAQIRNTAENSGLATELFEYPRQVTNTQSWFDLIDKDSGLDASLIVLKPEASIYSDEQQKANHFSLGTQAYGLAVRNTAHEHGHGIVILAPEGISALTYTTAFRSNPDMHSYSSLSVNLATSE